MKSYMVSQTDPVHPSDELLLALIHEQSFDDSAAIRGHVAACASCTERSRALSASDTLVATLLGSLDHPLPEARPSFGARTSHRWRQAALIAGAAATMAAAAAAMVPSSPLHRWLVSQQAPAAPVHAVAAPTSPQVPTAAVSNKDAALASGIAIPAQATLVVEFRREQESGVVELVRSAPGDVTFRSRGGATAYEVAEGRVAIDNQSPAEVYMIDIPTTVRQVRIHVGNRTLLRWPEDSARLVTRGDAGRASVALRAPVPTTP